jgi:cation transport ATPase
MANPSDDDDEPTGPARILDDEREDYTPPVPKTAAVTGSDTVEMRRLMLEEMRFHLEERKELHKMEIEMRKVEQEEKDKERDQTRKDKDQEAKEEKGNEHWAKSFWRPAMGWLYMIICFMDFVGFPVLTIFLPIIFKPFGLTMPYTAWQSLTLANGGLIHIAFGAILGVAAFSRGQEKPVPGQK